MMQKILKFSRLRDTFWGVALYVQVIEVYFIIILMYIYLCLMLENGDIKKTIVRKRYGVHNNNG